MEIAPEFVDLMAKNTVIQSASSFVSDRAPKLALRTGLHGNQWIEVTKPEWSGWCMLKHRDDRDEILEEIDAYADEAREEESLIARGWSRACDLPAVYVARALRFENLSTGERQYIRVAFRSEADRAAYCEKYGAPVRGRDGYQPHGDRAELPFDCYYQHWIAPEGEIDAALRY